MPWAFTWMGWWAANLKQRGIPPSVQQVMRSPKWGSGRTLNHCLGQSCPCSWKEAEWARQVVRDPNWGLPLP